MNVSAPWTEAWNKWDVPKTIHEFTQITVKRILWNDDTCSSWDFFLDTNILLQLFDAYMSIWYFSIYTDNYYNSCTID